MYRDECASQVTLVVKNPPGNEGDSERPWFDLRLGKIIWRREWLPTALLLLGESQGQRSLMGYSPWGRTESDTTEAT